MSDTRVTFRISPKLRKAMRRRAQALGKSEAEFMRGALGNFLQSGSKEDRQRQVESAAASRSALQKRDAVRGRNQ